jgi:S-adenosylmethionine:tRNA ribosyltransferase-isomerase
MKMDIKDFYYLLPDSLIAQYPAMPRDSSKLMILNYDGSIKHKKFFNIIDFLKSGDVLVLNKTKVIRAKLVGKKETGSRAEIILIRLVDAKNNLWEARIKTKNPNPGIKILIGKENVEIIKRKSVDEYIIRLSSRKILEKAMLPSPPYIRRELTELEYQTVYSKKQGSLAAPTAGLHFTRGLLNKIRQKGVKIVFVTLHVGFGTFLPITRNIENHRTEAEYFEITRSCADKINNRTVNDKTGRLVVVGTTSLKALESCAKDNKIYPAKRYSDIFIYPGHKFNSGTDILITNFHLPKSSLILLTSAFAGRERLMKAYDIAVKEQYRFYSLGDAMMIYGLKKT